MHEAPAAQPLPPEAAPVSPAASRETVELHPDVRQQLAEIEQVYQYSPVGLVLMDREYRFVRINDRLAEINGLSAEAHIGRTLHAVLPDMADRLIEFYRPVYERGEPVLNVELQRPIPGERNTGKTPGGRRGQAGCPRQRTRSGSGGTASSPGTPSRLPR